MSGYDLVVLGTASQVPTRTRNHNGYLLRWGHEGLLFDPGEGTQRQFTFAGVSTARVTRILLTHLHGDHCLGLPGVLQRMAQDAPEREVPLRITALPLVHRVPVLGWRVEEPGRVHLLPERLDEYGVHGPDAGRLLHEGSVEVDGRTVTVDQVGEVRPGRSAAVVMDTSVCDNALRLADGVDLLLCEATFLESESHLAREYGHLTARHAATIAREAGVGLLVLTHFSSRYPDMSGHLREATEVFPDTVVATDLSVVPFP